MSGFISYKASNIHKSFSSVPVLMGIDFEVKAGQIHGLFGHNGAGKSTLLKILSGDYSKDSGQISLNDNPVFIKSPSDAIDMGICCVYQELRLIGELSVWKNIFLGREIKRGMFLDEALMQEHAKKLLKEYNLEHIDINSDVKDLSHPDKQMLEVVANLDRDVKVLILDEPTTALEGKQALNLLTQVKDICKSKQIGVVIVSHKLDEVLWMCDEATVMCSGKVIYHDVGENINKEQIIKAIMGKDEDDVAFSKLFYSFNHTDEALIQIDHLKTPRLKDINLKAYKSEILGIYGLIGSGRTRLARTIYGLEEIISGTILYQGNSYRPTSPKDSIKSGIAYLTEDRKIDGFVPLMNSIDNS